MVELSHRDALPSFPRPMVGAGSPTMPDHSGEGRMSEPASLGPIEVELRDHRHVRLREMRPDDRDEIRQAFGRLSNDSRYTRFMSSVRELSPRMLEDVLHRRTERELGLVAEIDATDGIDI